MGGDEVIGVHLQLLKSSLDDLGRRPVRKPRSEQRKRLFLRVYGRDVEAFLKQVHHSLADSATQLERLAPLWQMRIQLRVVRMQGLGKHRFVIFGPIYEWGG